MDLIWLVARNRIELLKIYEFSLVDLWVKVDNDLEFKCTTCAACTTHCANVFELNVQTLHCTSSLWRSEQWESKTRGDVCASDAKFLKIYSPAQKNATRARSPRLQLETRDSRTSPTSSTTHQNKSLVPSTKTSSETRSPSGRLLEPQHREELSTRRQYYKAYHQIIYYHNGRSRRWSHIYS